ncbi:MAG: HAD family phosphatase [Lachnospiraceae bacterium]|nr:HAD family phosphatase [Lachnospiraceae bacterium]
MIKNVVFDIGNVLSKFNYQEHFRKFAKDQETYERLLNATVMTPTWDELDRGVWGEQAIVDRFVEQDPGIEKEIRDMYAHMDGIMEEYPYSTEWIKSLQKRGYRVLIISNFSELILRTNRKEMKFMDVIDGGILSYREKVIKPDPAIYELLMRQYDLRAEECIFLDDRIENVEGARAVGFQGILVTSQEAAVAELETYLV